MKNTARLLALVLSLMLALTCAAFAEPDATIYTLSLLDPMVYYNDEVAIDLTGLNIDLNALVTDSDVQQLFTDIYVGEDFDYITALTLQLDNNGIFGYLDGMKDVYGTDITMLTGINPGVLVGSMALRSSIQEMGAIELDMPTRADLMVALASSFEEYKTSDVENGYAFTITDEQGKALLQELGMMMYEADPETASDYMEMITEADASFNLAGTVVMNGDPYTNGAVLTIDATGALVGEGEPGPITLKYTDDMANADLLAQLCDPEGAVMISLIMDSDSIATADGRAVVNTDIEMNVVDEEPLLITYTSTPISGSKRTDNVLTLSAEDTILQFKVSTGTYEDGIGFSAGVTATEYGDTVYAGIEYAGEYVEDSESGPYHAGYFGIEMDDGYDLVSFETGVMLYATECSTADMALDTSSYVDVMTIDDAQMESAMTDFETVLMDAVMKIAESVPGIATLMGSM